MTNSWISPAVGTAWTIVFALILLVHLWHAARMSGAHRLWHGGHLLMALGMIVMFAPTRAMLVPASVGTVVFMIAAAALAGYLIFVLLRGRGAGPLWMLSVVDLVWMAYMFTIMVGRGLSWLSVIGAVFFVLQTLAWASGALGRVLDRHGLGALRCSPSPRGRHEHAGGIVDGGTHDWSIRVSLALMALGMAYMLATTYGMVTMSAISGMPGMTSPMP